MRQPERRLRWSVETRLEFIEFRLFWEGVLNRSDIIDHFGVSVPQASNDLSRYQELAPANIRYDRSLKRYFATDKFKPRFFRPDADRYLNQLRAIGDRVSESHETWLTTIPTFDTMPIPRRRVEPALLRSLLTTIRNKRSVEIHYQSLTRPDALWRRITPHALATDGLRWHVRAFCHIDRTFKDFLLPRLLDIRREAEPDVEPAADTVWHEHADVVLTPHPQLNDNQRRVVSIDYGMDGESITIPVRLALLYYFLRRLNLDGDAERRPHKEQHVVLANKSEVRAALKRAQQQTPIAA